MVAKDRMRREQALDREDAMLGYERGRYNPQDYNTLGPNEEVLEYRRVHKRNRVAMAAPRRSNTGNILMENFFFLLLLSFHLLLCNFLLYLNHTCICHLRILRIVFLLFPIYLFYF